VSISTYLLIVGIWIPFVVFGFNVSIVHCQTFKIPQSE
jgi:hypothetical protein